MQTLSQTHKKKVLFIHHSTGANLIKEGHLREHVYKLIPNVEFWDHNYNLSPYMTSVLAKCTNMRGLCDPKGVPTLTDFNINISNYSPKEYAELFSRTSTGVTLRSLLSFDVIAFKNCFPATCIHSDTQLLEVKNYYESIRKFISKFNEKTFVLLTPPPCRKEITNSEQAKRAKSLVEFLTDHAFVKAIPNLHIFNFFGLLADENGFLKRDYTLPIPIDSHPNRKANLAVAPIFAEFLVDVLVT